MSSRVVDRPALARTAPGIAVRSPRWTAWAVGGDLVVRQVEQPDEVGVGEAAVADTDAVLAAEPRRGRAWGMPSPVNVPIGTAPIDLSGPRRRTPAMAASPPCSRRASWSSWSAMASQPISPRTSMAAWRATAPMTLGNRLLTLGRVSPGDLVEVDEVDGAAAGEERVAIGEGGPAADHTPAPNGAHICDRSTPHSRQRRAAAGGGELGGVDEHGDRAAWAAAMTVSSGGDQPVTFDAGDRQQDGSARCPGRRRGRRRRTFRPGRIRRSGVDTGGPRAAGWRDVRPRW